MKRQKAQSKARAKEPPQPRVTDYFGVKKSCRSPTAKRSKLNGMESQTTNHSDSTTLSHSPIALPSLNDAQSPRKRKARTIRDDPLLQPPAELLLKSPKVAAIVAHVSRPVLTPPEPSSSEATNCVTIDRSLNDSASAPPRPVARKLGFEELSASTSASEGKTRIENLRDGLKKFIHDADSVASTSTKSPEIPPLPAFERYAHLRLPSTLCLPPQYDRLAQQFRHTDSTVAMLHNRGDTIFFTRLREYVQLASKRNFGRRELAQIKHVYPTAYEMSYQTGPSNGERRRSAEVTHDIVLRPNMGSDLLGVATVAPSPTSSPVKSSPPSSPRKTMQQLVQSPIKQLVQSPMKQLVHSPIKQLVLPYSPTKQGHREISPGHVKLRLDIFRYRLIEYAKAEHDKFLSSLPEPVVLSALERSSLKRWHPRFRLDKVAEIPEAAIPQPPGLKKVTTAKEAFQILSEISLPSKLQSAVKDKVSPLPLATPKSPPVSAPPVTPSTSALKGVNSSMLQRIQAKQAAARQATLQRDLAAEQRKADLERLPEIARSLSNWLLCEGGKPKPMRVIEDHLSQSCRLQPHPTKTRELITLLRKTVPGWIICRERPPFPVLLNSKMSLTDVLQTLSSEIEKTT